MCIRDRVREAPTSIGGRGCHYPSDEYLTYLMTVDEMMFADEIDCSDLFGGNSERERIIIFEIG